MLDYYLEREGAQSVIGRLVVELGRISGAEEHLDWRVQTLFGGVLGSLYSLLQYLTSPFWGRISDRHGRRPILLLTVGGMALSYLLWAASGSFLLLVISRLLGGAMAGNIATATAAAADVTTRAERARGMGVVGAAFGLGFILGPAIGGGLSLIDLEGRLPSSGGLGLHPFSAAALGAFLLSAANLLWVFRRFRETLPPEKRGGGRAARRVLNPLRLLGGWLGKGIQRTNIAYFIFVVAFSGMEFTLTFLVRERFLWGPGEIAAMFVFVGLVLALVQGGVVRRIVPRYGEKRLAVAGLALNLPGFALLAWASGGGSLYLGLTLMSVGSALAIPTLTSLVSLYAPEERQGEAVGIFRSVGALSRAIGPFLACAVYWSSGAETPYLAGAAILILPILLACGLPPPPTTESS